MKLEDIVNMFNKHIEDKRETLNIKSRSKLVLLKTILPHNTIKAYKEVELCLWYVNGKERYRVLTLHNTLKILTGQEEDIIDDMSKEFILMMFNWINSDFYKQVIKGEYKGYETT